MPRRPCVAALALCLAFLGACERPARRVRRKRPSQFEAELTRREEALDATEDKLVEVLKDVAPADEDATATPPAPDLAGVGEMRAQVRAMRQAVASIVLTPHDTEASTPTRASGSSSRSPRSRAASSRSTSSAPSSSRRATTPSPSATSPARSGGTPSAAAPPS